GAPGGASGRSRPGRGDGGGPRAGPPPRPAGRERRHRPRRPDGRPVRRGRPPVGGARPGLRAEGALIRLRATRAPGSPRLAVPAPPGSLPREALRGRRPPTLLARFPTPRPGATRTIKRALGWRTRAPNGGWERAREAPPAETGCCKENGLTPMDFMRIKDSAPRNCSKSLQNARKKPNENLISHKV